MTEKRGDSRRAFVRTGITLSGGLLAPPVVGTAEAYSNETLRTIHSLRSTHGNFSDRRVSEQDLTTVIEASVRAANASNMQSYSIVVSRDAAKIQKLTTYRAPCLLLYCADYTRLIDTAKYLGHEYHADNLDAFITSSPTRFSRPKRP